MSIKEEQTLIIQARKDPEAFGQLYDHYFPSIFNYIYRRTLDFDLTKDIASEVFLKAYLNIWKFRWRNIPFGAWLYRIATNEINQYFRRKNYTPHSLHQLCEHYHFEPVDPASLEREKCEAERQLQQYHDFITIQNQLKTLSLKYQEVIALRYFEGKSIKEVSQILQKKEGTVKSLLSRGLAQLRKMNKLS